MNAPIALALVALLAPARPVFAQPDKDLVAVNGTPIRQSELFDRLWKRYGSETLDEMVAELLLRQAAARAGIKIDAAEVDKRYAKVRSQFSDAKLFEAELATAGSSVDALKAELKDQLSREKLVAAKNKLSVGEEELKKAFEAHKGQLGRPEALHLRHLLVKTKEEAEGIVAAVKGGARFTDLARQKSQAPTGKINGGDYGFVSRGMLPADIEQVAFAMRPNDLRVLPSEKGYHVLQALERRPAAPAVFAKVKDDLREMILQEKIKAALPDFLRDLRSKANIQLAR